jgi:chromosome segregation ATPase
MWIWLTISIVLVIAIAVFGIYSFKNSRALQKLILPETGHKSNTVQSLLIKNGFAGSQLQAILNLKANVKSLEKNYLLSTGHLNDLQKRIEALESGSNHDNINEDEKWNDSDEDWEKLYYEERREKQSLEDNFNNVKDALAETTSKLHELDKQRTDWVAVKSDLEISINEVTALQNIIEKLQHKINGSAEREQELQQQIACEKSRYFEYELLLKQNNQLHSETDMLLKNLEEANAQNIMMKEKIKSFTQLRATSEEYNSKI